MTRLCAATLGQLPADVKRPAYDRASVRCGVVHLGIGAFHRAHQAVIFDRVLAGGDDRWGIIGASLRSAGVRDALSPQDGLYSVVVDDGAAATVDVIGAVMDVLVAPEDPERLIAAMAHPDIHLVTLTITEKGYKLDPASGALMLDDADVRADSVDLSAPRTAPGFLVAALARRRASGLPPFTAISCDNLPHNGSRLREAVLALAARHDPALRDWIATQGAFPSTMVDRIVPATQPSDIAALASSLGVEDRAMVKTEPFLQWVIEDDFCGSRPDFEALGVQLTPSVAPWEAAKLRLLNGAHSAIAYLGLLADMDYVSDFVAIPGNRAFLNALWDEAAETLAPPPGLDITAYRDALLTRFSNKSLQHRLQQIAMDGSQKLPQRILAAIEERSSKGQQSPALISTVAAWILWILREVRRGAEILDPLGKAFEKIVQDSNANPSHTGKALLCETGLAAQPLRDDPHFWLALDEAIAKGAQPLK